MIHTLIWFRYLMLIQEASVVNKSKSFNFDFCTYFIASKTEDCAL